MTNDCDLPGRWNGQTDLAGGGEKSATQATEVAYRYETIRARTRTVAPLLVAAVVAVCAGCVCETDVEERVISPNGEFVAEAVHTDCGALSEYATVVRVRRNRGLLNCLAIGNEDVLVVNNELPVWLRWAGDAELVVRYRDHRGT